MDTDLIINLTEITESNLSNEKFGPEQLAEKAGMSHSTLHRKLKSEANQSISQFIREIRLKKSRELLLSTNSTISEIAYQVGFGSATYFNKCFHDHFGSSPGEYRNNITSQENQPTMIKHSKKRIITYYIILVFVFVFVGVLLNKKFSFISEQKDEKSIAVMPFIFLGEDQKESFKARATENTILLHLQKIENLRVITGISLEQYKSAKAIGREHNVSFLLQGDFQQEESGYKLVLRLIRMKDEALEWSEEYSWNSNEVAVNESRVAQKIAGQLGATITSSEKQLIEKRPTTDLVAYSFYQRGIDEFLKYQNNTQNKDALERAEMFYEKAIEKDHEFAKAYSGLARIYWTKNYKKDYFSDSFLDSVLYWSEKALSFDNELEEAHLIRGMYYRENNKFNKALADIHKSIELNPNNWEAFEALNQIYTWDNPDMVKALEFGRIAVNLNQGNDLIRLYEKLGFTYACVDRIEEAQKYYTNAYDLTGDQDSVRYFLNMATLEQYQRNYINADKYLIKALENDSSELLLLRRLGGNYNLLREFEESLHFYKRYFKGLMQTDHVDFGETHRMAQAYYKTGNRIEADKYFNIQINECLKSIDKNRGFAQSSRAHYDLAAVYAFQGKKEEAYKSLNEFVKMDFFPLWWINLAKDDPLFDSIRNEKRFHDFLLQMENKYQKERKRVEEWLNEKDIIEL